jgi:heme exporter protein A
MSGTGLRFTDLRRGYGKLRVLPGVTATVAAGEVLLVTGRNGSGKSTLLRCLAGLLAPEAGRIELQDAGRALDPAERRRAVGYVGPDLALYEELTCEENLAFFARLRRLPPARGRELLAQVGLPPGRLCGALSSGMRQRLRWAWALLHRPRVLLLDEPFQNLDEPGEALARALLAEHLREGLAVVASPTHIEDLPGIAARLHLDDLSPGGQAPGPTP